MSTRFNHVLQLMFLGGPRQKAFTFNDLCVLICFRELQQSLTSIFDFVFPRQKAIQLCTQLSWLCNLCYYNVVRKHSWLSYMLGERVGGVGAQFGHMHAQLRRADWYRPIRPPKEKHGVKIIKLPVGCRCHGMGSLFLFSFCFDRIHCFVLKFGQRSVGLLNKKVKPYTCLQSQGHAKNGLSYVVASLMLMACFVAESIQRWFLCICRPTVTLHRGQGHRKEHEQIIMASISLSSCQVWM